MIETFLLHLLESSLLWVLLMLPYVFVFRRTTFFRIHRFLVLGIALVALIAPWLHIAESTGGLVHVELPVFFVNEPGYVESNSTFDLYPILFWIWVIGAGIVLMYFMYQILQLILFLHRIKSTRKEDYYLIEHRGSTYINFSFFSRIYLDASMEEQDRQCVLLHERVHVREWHSLDHLLMGMFKAIFWFHLLAWWSGSELSRLHEYIADDHARGSDDVHYQQVLIGQMLGVPVSKMVNSFSRPGLTKIRIHMMNKMKTKPYMALSYLLFLPLFLGWISLSSFEMGKPMQEPVVKEVDKMAEFPGGQQAMMEFLVKNIQYPKDASEKNIQGKVYVQFIVSSAGVIGDVKVARGIDPSLDAEAVRVVKLMPNWTAAEKGGKKVASQMTLPIMFKL
jgi:TonB family protein